MKYKQFFRICILYTYIAFYDIFKFCSHRLNNLFKVRNLDEENREEITDEDINGNLIDCVDLHNKSIRYDFKN